MLAAFESLQVKAASAPNRETFVGNPLNSYVLIKHMTVDWKKVKNAMTSSPVENFFPNVTTIGQKWPSDEDLSGATRALVRLQVCFMSTHHEMLYNEIVMENKIINYCIKGSLFFKRIPTNWIQLIWPKDI